MSHPVVNTYRYDIQFFRGLAVLLVVFYHFKVPGFSFGYLGVDIFLMLSGYLIFGNNYDALNGYKWSFCDYIFKRFLRIIPALLVIIIFVSIYTVYEPPFKSRDTFQSIFASVLHLSNILYWLESSNYFGVDSDVKLLIHTWSLGLEIQYYIFFTIFVYMGKKIGFKFAIYSMLLLGFISFLFYIFNIDKSYSFYLLPFRFWEFVLGSTAYFLLKRSRQYNSYKSVFKYLLDIIALSFGMSVFILLFLFQSYLVLFVLLSVFVFLCFPVLNHYCNRFSILKIFVYLGTISYSVYLVHQPLYVILSQSVGDYLYHGIALSIFLGWLMYVFVENKSQNYFYKRRFMFYCIASVISFFLLFYSFFGHYTKGYQEVKVEHLNQESWIYVDHYKSLSEKNIFYNGLSTSIGTKEIVLVGDSIAGDFESAFKFNPELSNKFYIKRFSLSYDCMSQVDVILEAANSCDFSFSEYVTGLGKGDIVIFAFAVQPDGLQTYLDFVASVARSGAHVYIYDTPKFRHISDVSYEFMRSGMSISDLPKYVFDQLDPGYVRAHFAISHFVESFPSNMTYLSRFDRICSYNLSTCNIYVDYKPLLHDQHHSTVIGIKDLSRFIGDIHFE